MKSKTTILAAVFAAAFAAMAAWNFVLRAGLADAREQLAALSAAQSMAKPPALPRRPLKADDGKKEEPAPAPSAPVMDDSAFEQAVEERVKSRMEEIHQQREAEREARRREWENETDEQREARRREFQSRMQEHAAARLAEFIKKAELSEEQCAALEDELGLLDSRVREIAEVFASDIGDGAKFDFEAQMQLFYNMSGAIIDTYAGLDEVLPEGWRERDGEFNVLFGIGADAVNPLFDALRKSGVRFGPGMIPGMGPPPGMRPRRQR